MTFHDVRLALRSLVHDRSVSAIVILCLALGIGVAQYPSTNDGWSALMRPITDKFIPNSVRLVLSTMMGAVTLVLLVACANVANLMVVRSSGRQREFCVRAARGQLVKQLLTECVALGLAAAPLGLAIADLGVWVPFDRRLSKF